MRDNLDLIIAALGQFAVQRERQGACHAAYERSATPDVQPRRLALAAFGAVTLERHGDGFIGDAFELPNIVAL